MDRFHALFASGADEIIGGKDPADLATGSEAAILPAWLSAFPIPPRSPPASLRSGIA